MEVHSSCAVYVAPRRSLSSRLASRSGFDFESRNVRSRPISRHRRGMATVELAIVAPVFLLFVFGMIEFSRMVMIKQAMTNAAREGCRIAVMANTRNSDDVDEAIHDYLEPVVPNIDAVRIAAPEITSSIASGRELTVRVEVDFKDVSWVPTAYMGFNPTVSAEATHNRE